MPKNRVEWVDYAKGITIILVVLHHATYRELYSESISYFNSILELIRMPLFFFISGLFIHRSITGERSDFVRKKVMPLLYLFVLWSIIRYFTDTVPRRLFLEENESNLSNLFVIFIDPSGTYWYIYALLVFLIMTRFIRSIPAIALSFSMLFFVISFQVGDYTFLFKLARFYPFFLLGYLTSSFVIDKASKVRSYHLVVPFLGFAAVAFMHSGIIANESLSFFMSGSIGIISGIIIAVFLTKFSMFSWLSYVGKNTLIIYLLHYIPHSAFKLILPKLMGNLPELAILIMVITGVIFPLVVAYIAKRIGMDWLFNFPFHLFDKLKFTSSAKHSA